MKPPIKPKKKL